MMNMAVTRRFVLLIAIAGGFALPAAARGQAIVTWQRVQLPGVQGYVSLDTMGIAGRVPGRPDAVFARLRTAYGRLQVRAEIDDSAHGMLGTLRTARTLAIGEAVMSRVFDCGVGPSGPLADNARVRIAMVSFLVPAGPDSTSLRTGLIGSAQSMDGALSGALACRSTGFLETWLLQELGGRIR